MDYGLKQPFLTFFSETFSRLYGIFVEFVFVLILTHMVLTCGQLRKTERKISCMFIFKFELY